MDAVSLALTVSAITVAVGAALTIYDKQNPKNPLHVDIGRAEVEALKGLKESGAVLNKLKTAYEADFAAYIALRAKRKDAQATAPAAKT